LNYFVSYIAAVRGCLLDREDIVPNGCQMISNRDGNCGLGECYGITKIRSDYWGIVPITVNLVSHRVFRLPRERKRREQFLEFVDTLPLFVPCIVTKSRGKVDIAMQNTLVASPRGSPKEVADHIWQEVVHRTSADRRTLGDIHVDPF
jgi:hypothetical protein